MGKTLDGLNRFKPSVVLANLSPISFEVLRYAPKGVFRIGTGQADHPLVYDTMKKFAPFMDAAGVVSQSMKQKTESMPEFGRTPVHYLPYGVPVPAAAREPAGDIQRPLRILYLGRLYREQKRVQLFPQILEQLQSAGIPFHWTVAGEGPEKEALEQTMKSTPSQTVSFPGTISYAQVPELLRAHDVFLMASDYEGLPLSLLEAMGEGLVPVVSDLPSGIPEVVDETNGILVAPDDVSGYARAIIRLANDRGELASLSRNAHERVKAEFSVEAMTDRWLYIFPKQIPAIGDWPTHGNIKPPLSAPHPLWFSPPMRAIRRLVAKFR
jgi:glycosyltransferase involved in cell wall biosynthesis